MGPKKRKKRKKTPRSEAFFLGKKIGALNVRLALKKISHHEYNKQVDALVSKSLRGD